MMTSHEQLYYVTQIHRKYVRVRCTALAVWTDGVVGLRLSGKRR